ncbi:MAG: hypothetical protein SGJ19_00385 [Planctomycetia bacterium]|nr:hypothetical protein [Planctomycetia bacterium]
MPGIRERVAAVRARQQRQWLWLCLSWGLLAGGAAGVVYGLAAAISTFPLQWSMVGTLLAAGPAAGALFAVARPRPLRAAAVAIDRSCSLKDRVATALNLMSKSGATSPVHALQLADAEDHVAKIDPAAVAPILAPRPWYWGLSFSVAALVIAFFVVPDVQVVAAPIANKTVALQAARVENSLEDLKEFNKEQADPEIEKLLKELAAKIEELKQPGLDPKEALAKLSEMEAALQQQQTQLNDPNVAAELQSLGEALSLAEPFQSAGEAMSQGEMDKAAEELAKLELPKLDRQTERAVTEKLEQAQQNSSEGQQKRLKEAIGQMSQGLSQGDKSKFKDGAQGLAGECKKQGRRKKLSDLLQKQCQCLSECKGECESECKNAAMSNKKGGKNWGLGASGNELGDKTAQLKTSPQMNLTGQESGEGDVDVETMTSPEQQQEAIREYREKAKQYEQLSESVLDSEPIPLGHRQTIRRYFEMIRPQAGETDSVNEATGEAK